ncbi:MAG: ABC transporter substrate-binding protein [Pseudomonadota bacterium]
MTIRRNSILLAAAVTGSIVLSGVATAETVVHVTRANDTERYDMHKTTARSSADVGFMIFDTLVSLDYDMQTIRPGLASSWEVSEDGLVYTFTLRQDVTFCSGKTLDADAVVASIKRWLDPETGGVVKSKAGEVDDIVATGPYTVEYRLKSPYSELLLQMTQHFFSIINAEEAAAHGADYGVQAVDGTGPFCFESWEPRNKTVLVKHEAYNWGPPQFTYSAPQVDKIIWAIGPEESTRVASIQTGQTDVLQHTPFWAVPQLEADANLHTSQAEAYFWNYYIGMKITRPFMQDVRVRQAINLAVDSAAIADAVYFGLAEPANTYMSQNVIDFDPSVGTDQFGYDPEQAAALLEEAGWKMGSDGFREKDGEKLELTAYAFTIPVARQIIEAVQGDLRKAGIDLQIELYDSTVIWGKLKTQDFDMYTMSYPYLTASDGIALYFSSKNMPAPNRMNWNDPEETDVWLQKANAAPTVEERQQWVSKILHKVHGATVWIPIAHEPLFIFANARKLKPVRAHGIYGAGLYKGLELAPK